MSARKNIKTCAVPLCTNSTLSTPHKLLFYIPINPARRNKWLSAMGLKVTDLSPNVHRYCCQDHFDLPNDADNWVEYSIRQCKVRLKNDVVPHIFACQPNRKRATSTVVFVDGSKRQRPEFVDVNAIASTALTEFETSFSESNTRSVNLDNIPSTYQVCESLVVPGKPFLLTKGVQARPHFRSKYVQCTRVFKDASTSPLRQMSVDASTSPIRTFEITAPVKKCKRKLY